MILRGSEYTIARRRLLCKGGRGLCWGGAPPGRPGAGDTVARPWLGKGLHQYLWHACQGGVALKHCSRFCTEDRPQGPPLRTAVVISWLGLTPDRQWVPPPLQMGAVA